MGEIFKFVVSSLLVMVEVRVFLARSRGERKPYFHGKRV